MLNIADKFCTSMHVYFCDSFWILLTSIKFCYTGNGFFHLFLRHKNMLVHTCMSSSARLLSNELYSKSVYFCYWQSFTELEYLLLALIAAIPSFLIPVIIVGRVNY